MRSASARACGAWRGGLSTKLSTDVCGVDRPTARCGAVALANIGATARGARHNPRAALRQSTAPRRDLHCFRSYKPQAGRSGRCSSAPIVALALVIERFIEPAQPSRVAPPRLLDEVISVSARSRARARRRHQARAELGARRGAGQRPARRDRRPALHRGRPARRHRGRRPRRRAPAGALPERAGHHRLGGAAARPAGHGDRHDRDLRLAGARRRRQQPGAARARHLGRALQHRLRPDHRDPGADLLALLPRPGRRLPARPGAGRRAPRAAPDALRDAARHADAPMRAHELPPAAPRRAGDQPDPVHRRAAGGADLPDAVDDLQQVHRAAADAAGGRRRRAARLPEARSSSRWRPTAATRSTSKPVDGRSVDAAGRRADARRPAAGKDERDHLGRRDRGAPERHHRDGSGAPRRPRADHLRHAVVAGGAAR